MKTLTFIAIVLVALAFASCKKEYVKPQSCPVEKHAPQSHHVSSTGTTLEYKLADDYESKTVKECQN